MRRAAAALGNDVRLQVRYGLYAVSVVMVLFWGVLLGALNRSAFVSPELVVVPFIAINLVITTFYFMAAMVLFEKGEGVLAALVTSPLRASEYLLSKSLTLAGLGAAESVLIVVLVFGWTAAPLRVVVGAVVLGIFYSLAGFLTVVRFESINGFLIPSVLVTILLLAPLLVHFGLLGETWILWHPAHPSMQLMRGGSRAAGVVAILWCGGALLLARREFGRFVVRT